MKIQINNMLTLIFLLTQITPLKISDLCINIDSINLKKYFNLANMKEVMKKGKLKGNDKFGKIYKVDYNTTAEDHYWSPASAQYKFPWGGDGDLDTKKSEF